MEKISFKEIANSMGMEVDAARISLSLPPVIEEVLHYRAFCFAELLIKRNQSVIEKITKHSFGEVKRVFTNSSTSVVALIQFNSAPQCFPLEIPISALMGHEHGIVQKIRKLERELHLKIHVWNMLTKSGTKQIPLMELIQDMKVSLEKKLVS